MLMLPQSEDLPELNTQPLFYWNHAGLEMNRVTTSVMGPQGGPTMGSRALGLLHLAIHDAYVAVELSLRPGAFAWGPYLPPQNPAGTVVNPLPGLGGANDSEVAMAGAAVTVLDRLYSSPGPGISIAATQTLLGHLSRVIAEYPNHLDVLSASYRFGVEVARAVLNRLAVQAGEPGADQGRYEPRTGRFFFRDEPTHPVRLRPIDPNTPDGPKRAERIYHGPFYGATARVFAAQNDHILADPPRDTQPYVDALKEVVALGGAPNLSSTTRTPDQTTAGYYWAYDGSNLVGTPPRLYNQILRAAAWANRREAVGVPVTQVETDEFVRLFALANVAMADAGVFCWREKYHFEFWRPLSGVREHDRLSGPKDPTPHDTNPVTAPNPGEKLDPDANPFWLTLGAPDTNSHNANFKPPFPAYPSGHATFGAAAFQIARRFYKDQRNLAFGVREEDELGFTFVSDELNGVCRDLDQPYDPNALIEDQPGDVRTRVERRFPSLWDAIVENGLSRIYLGVHWIFDSFVDTGAAGPGRFARGDRTDWPALNAPVIANNLPIGGVPLGLDIADDIYDSGLTPPPTSVLGPSSAAPAPAARDQAAPALQPDATPKSSNTNLR